jgi:hypothetical protein
MGEVVELPVQTTQDIPVPKVLSGAADCTEVLIVGTSRDGTPFYASSTADKYRMLWILERARLKLLDE